MEQYEATAPLPNHEEYFEWIGLLDAVATARRRFVMMEFGAGFGRWGVRGALAARQVGLAPSEIAVTFVEAEPDHVQWLRDTIAMNRGLDGVKTNLVDAAVTGADGEVLFATGHSKEWYGQEITCAETDYARLGLHAVNKIAKRAVSIGTLINSVEMVDLIHMDIQGAEADAIESSVLILQGRVRRLCIGTHRQDFEARIRKALGNTGWHNVFAFPCGRMSETPYGPVTFQDGVQVWINSNLERAESGAKNFK